METLRLNREAFAALAVRLRPAYADARPFPHVVIDDFLPSAALDAVLAEFPEPERSHWTRYRDPVQTKLGQPRVSELGAASRRLLAELNSAVVCEFLERLTGIDALIPDPSFRGGGLHQIERGGFLKVHADFNWHRQLRLHRRANLLLYLNRDWRESYGGHLELWDREMRVCARRILPIFNRCVIFDTSSTSYHGHPEPLVCPEGRTRKSVAIYYYSRNRPVHERHAPHSTIFRRRPGERFQTPASGSPREKWRRGGTVWRRGAALARRALPPVLLGALRDLRGRGPGEG